MTEPRKFTSSPAVRASIPLWIGLYGPSFSGKTYSALRLARGIHSVVGGKIAIADTESRRALHYADEFKFHHYPFDPPFDPRSYQDLIETMAADGVTVAIIDSASHEHEGPGGVLEMHEDETERLAKAWKVSREQAQASGWIKPKRQRLQMIDAAKRTRLHIIWCFRAQNKMDFKPKKPVPKGFVAIGGEVLIYDMAVTALLLPGAGGVPTWQSAEIGEKLLIKLPHWARAMLRSGAPLDEDLGAALARWAQGSDAVPAAPPAPPKPPNVQILMGKYRECSSLYAFEALERMRGEIWEQASKYEKRQLKESADEARVRAAKASADEIDIMAADDDDDDGPPEGTELPMFGEEPPK